jgi:hypothetical protein
MRFPEFLLTTEEYMWQVLIQLRGGFSLVWENTVCGTLVFWNKKRRNSNALIVGTRKI